MPSGYSSASDRIPITPAGDLALAENLIHTNVSGALLGHLMGTVRLSMRLRMAIPVVTVLGAVATVISGEFRIGWEYLLIDIPLVGASAVAIMLTARLVRRRVARR